MDQQQHLHVQQRKTLAALDIQSLNLFARLDLLLLVRIALMGLLPSPQQSVIVMGNALRALILEPHASQLSAVSFKAQYPQKQILKALTKL